MDLLEKAERLFALALELPRERRRELLDVVCENDPELHRELMSLLEYADTGSDFLAVPVIRRGFIEPVAPAAGDYGALDQGPPERIGDYKILRILGYGGMAVVYEARQPGNERSVALKLICPGPVTPELERRFQVEARLLARLRYPGIVRLYEAGVQDFPSPGGGFHRVPYLAMELVRGSRLDAYLTRSKLTLKDRLHLFAQICDAVDYAHRHGVLHRDLKPANILVDTAGKPKIVDFGIGRLLGEATDTPLTSPGQVVGSLAYLSPEQFAGDRNSIDERSDVYALGVILYEMLAGRQPFQVGHLPIAEAAAVVASARAVPLNSFDLRYRGELQEITAKAMAKDPSRRYSTAAALAEGIRRHLARQSTCGRVGHRLVSSVVVLGLLAVGLALVRLLPLRLPKSREIQSVSRN